MKRTSTWKEWLKQHHGALVASAVPGYVYADDARWVHLAEHGFVPEGAWGPLFDVGTLSPFECAALLALVEHEPNARVLVQVLASRLAARRDT